MKKEYIQPIVTELLVDPSSMMAGSSEGYGTAGQGAGGGEGGPPSGGGMGAKEGGSALWEEDAFSNDVFSDDED
mgnify:CR=1 FL=1